MAKNEIEKAGTAAIQIIQNDNEFGVLDKSEIPFFQPPFSVRNNKMVGMWALTEDEFIGKEIQIVIVATRPFVGTVGKDTEINDWLQVFFVPCPWESKIPPVVCVTYLKTISIESLSKALTIVRMEHNALEGFWKAGFKKHSNEKGDYYSVDFSWEKFKEGEHKDFQEKVIKLRASTPRNRWIDTNKPKGLDSFFDEDNYDMEREPGE